MNSSRSRRAAVGADIFQRLPRNGRGLSRFCEVRAAKWDSPPLRGRFGTVSRIAPFLIAGVLAILATVVHAAPPKKSAAFRPPAVPLVVHNPYLSIWSPADRLTDANTQHWTRRDHPLVSLVRIDGKTYRLMGAEPKNVPAFPQKSVKVTPTRTIYNFDDGHVEISLTFLTPALSDKLDVLARPVTYLTWDVKSSDGGSHKVSIYDSTSGLLSVSEPKSNVVWGRMPVGDLTVLQMGSEEQTLLHPVGDETRINWGFAYVAALKSEARAAIGPSAELMKSFAETGRISEKDDERMPRAANDEQPCMAFVFDLGHVVNKPASCHMMIAYDEIYSVSFLGRKLRPYWRRNGATIIDLLKTAKKSMGELSVNSYLFDDGISDALRMAGGERYADMAALAYRQALGGCGLAADANGQPMFFPKENSSNGCIATVDVIYPAAPLFLLMGPTYAKALVAPPLIYSTSPRWKFPFAPHDVGTYPRADGQVYGGGEESKNEADMMPVEESANLIILCAAIAKMEGKADFASRFWTQLTRWEAYLEKYGEDPQNQLCTDDFMGHLAHNANLSVKAILAIAAYGEMCRMRGDAPAADKFRALARQYAQHWMKMAGDGDHYRIAFDKPDTWSQKYNLVWDKLLDLDIFPEEVARKEVAHYKKQLQRYGVPLDSRTKLTKSDWCFWSATLADNRGDFEAIISPIYDYLNETTSRLPFVDSYITNDPKSRGMRARPVIGGVFIKMLEDPRSWKEWASRDTFKVGDYAPAPLPPKVTELVPTSKAQAQTWRFTLEKPGNGDAWTRPDFDGSHWRESKAPFASDGTPGVAIGTPWKTPGIWLRRTIQLPATLRPEQAQFLVFHDEDVAIYLDGVLAARESGWTTSYRTIEIRPRARERLKPGGKVTIAVHCRQTDGGQGIDVGIVDVNEQKP